MAKIQVLDKHTAELIAAGEVVERPASVVKELVENALDAGASSITVELKRGGVELIRVQDDGCGITREDVPTAFLRHATSKVRTEEDLDAIGTLGFRGEALASIAAVSRVELLTCTAGETVGTRYVLEGGEPVCCEDVGFPQGTAIVVRDLFFNVPARMKFLKKDVSEANAAAGVVDRLALSHPEVSFHLIRDGKQERVTPGSGDLRAAIYSVFGKSFADGMIPVDYTSGGVHVHGFVSRPEASRSNRTMQHFFVNGRYVKTRTAMAAAEEACKGSVMAGKYPACVLHIDLPAETVDANVHPAKIEVRFVQERPVFDAVYHGVKSALQAGGGPKNVTLPRAPFRQETAVTKEPPRQLSFQPEREIRPRSVSPAPPATVSVPVVPERDEGDTLRDRPSLWRPAQESTVYRPSVDIFVEEEPSPPPSRETAVVPPAEPEAEEVPQPEPLAQEEPEADLPFEKEPVRYLGEAFRTYLVVQQGESLFFIDKHAAHERILYNRLREQAHEESQQLLAPLNVSLSREEYAAVMDHEAELRQAGFEIEDFGGTSVLVRGIPMLLEGCDIAAAVQEIAGGLIDGRREIATERMEWIYASTACRAAVKAGDESRPEELQRLAERILVNKDIRTCPHGRPVCFEITRKELEKQFGRLV